MLKCCIVMTSRYDQCVLSRNRGSLGIQGGYLITSVDAIQEDIEERFHLEND
jgi:hypothetical protein